MPMSIFMHRLEHRINRRFLLYLFSRRPLPCLSFYGNKHTIVIPHLGQFQRVRCIQTDLSGDRNRFVQMQREHFIPNYFFISHLLGRGSHRRPGKRKPKRIYGMCVSIVTQVDGGMMLSRFCERMYTRHQIHSNFE